MWLGKAGALALLLCTLIQFISYGPAEFWLNQRGKPKEKTGIVWFPRGTAISNYSIQRNFLHATLHKLNVILGPVDDNTDRWLDGLTHPQDRLRDIFWRIENERVPRWLRRIPEALIFPRRCDYLQNLCWTTTNVLDINNSPRNRLLNTKYRLLLTDIGGHIHHEQIWPIAMKREIRSIGTFLSRISGLLGFFQTLNSYSPLPIRGRYQRSSEGSYQYGRENSCDLSYDGPRKWVTVAEGFSGT